MQDRRVVLKETHHPTGTELFLTSMKEEHLEHLIELAHDSVLSDLMGWNPFFESGETEQFIKALSCCALPYSQESEPLVFGVYLNPEDLPVGYAVLKGMNTELRTTEVGVAVLDRKYRTKGYGRLVLRRVVKYAFEELRMKTVGAAVLASNKKSVNMCKKTGFSVREVMRRSWSMPDGSLADMLWMEITAAYDC